MAHQILRQSHWPLGCCLNARGGNHVKMLFYSCTFRISNLTDFLLFVYPSVHFLLLPSTQITYRYVPHSIKNSAEVITHAQTATPSQTNGYWRLAWQIASLDSLYLAYQSLSILLTIWRCKKQRNEFNHNITNFVLHKVKSIQWVSICAWICSTGFEF